MNKYIVIKFLLQSITFVYPVCFRFTDNTCWLIFILDFTLSDCICTYYVFLFNQIKQTMGGYTDGEYNGGMAESSADYGGGITYAENQQYKGIRCWHILNVTCDLAQFWALSVIYYSQAHALNHKHSSYCNWCQCCIRIVCELCDLLRIKHLS